MWPASADRNPLSSRRIPVTVSRVPYRGVRSLGLIAALLLGGLSACVSREAPEDSRIPVVATTSMITYVAERVGGERIRVSGLMGPGIDPHLYRASAGDVRRLSNAEVIFYNGLHLEAAMAEVLREMDGRTRTRAVAEVIPEEQLLRPPEFEGQFDPHVWSDVRLWMLAVEAVEETLSDHDPDGASQYRENAGLLLEELEELDDWVRGRVEELPEDRRVLVTAHDAFHYFGEAYGFQVRGLQGLSTVAEAGTADVRNLARYIVEAGVPAIFVESSIPRRNIEAVQAAVRSQGGQVAIGGTLFSDAMGDRGTPEGTYPGMIRHNVNTIVDALSGEMVAQDRE